MFTLVIPAEELLRAPFAWGSLKRALLSSSSGLPIKQSIAVTGSVNRKREVQPIVSNRVYRRLRTLAKTLQSFTETSKMHDPASRREKSHRLKKRPSRLNN